VHHVVCLITQQPVSTQQGMARLSKSGSSRSSSGFSWTCLYLSLKFPDLIRYLSMDCLVVLETNCRVDSEFHHHPGAIEAITQNPADADQVITCFFPLMALWIYWCLPCSCAMHCKVSFLSASLYVSKRGAYWDRLCRDVVGRWLVGWLVGRWLSHACTVAKRCILGL